MRKFNTLDEVDSLTEKEAQAIVQRQFYLLVAIGGYSPLGLDDHGDYLFAAIENYSRLFHFYWDNDGTGWVEGVKAFLREDPDEWLGSDGEVRFEVFTEAYIEASWAAADARIKAEEGGVAN